MGKEPEGAPKKPGRKAETPAQRLERLQRDILLAKQAVKDADQRRLSTIGAAVLAEGEGDAEFMARLRDILRRRVETKAGKADVATLLAE
jgi:hypothetical protein